MTEWFSLTYTDCAAFQEEIFPQVGHNELGFWYAQADKTGTDQPVFAGGTGAYGFSAGLVLLSGDDGKHLMLLKVARPSSVNFLRRSSK